MTVPIFSRAAGLIRYLRVFASWGDVQSYREIAHFGSNLPVSVRVRGMPVPLPLRPGTTDAAVLWDTFHGRYHLPPFALPASPVILDLGANVGFTCAHLATLYPNSRIVAVEMDRGNAECATRLFTSLPQCELVHAAIWSFDGEVRYDPHESEWGYHVDINPSHDSLISVPAISMSTLAERYGLERIHYVKMDIEGAEWPVLSGNRAWLSRVDAIKVELHPQFNPMATYENCAPLLEASGFACKRDPIHFNALVAHRR